MARSRGKDIGMGRLSEAVIRRLTRLHQKAGGNAADAPAVRRPPDVAKCEGFFLWSARQAGFIGRHDGALSGGGRQFVACTGQAKRYASVEQARAAGDGVVGDVLVMYGYAANGPLYIVGR